MAPLRSTISTDITNDNERNDMDTATHERWHVRDEVNVHPAHARFMVHDENGLVVARVIGREDAHLIAAAPELLEAAEDALDAVTLTEQEDVPAWVTALESAIREARGVA